MFLPYISESWTCVCAWTCVSTRVHMNVYVRFSQVLCPANSSDLNLLKLPTITLIRKTARPLQGFSSLGDSLETLFWQWSLQAGQSYGSPCLFLFPQESLSCIARDPISENYISYILSGFLAGSIGGVYPVSVTLFLARSRSQTFVICRIFHFDKGNSDAQIFNKLQFGHWPNRTDRCWH